MIDPKLLDELEKLEAEATPGPWGEPWPTQHPGVVYDMAGINARDRFGLLVASCDRHPPDARLIAALRNAAPELIAEAREFSRACREWLVPDNRIPWEGGLGDAVAAAIKENNALKAELAELKLALPECEHFPSSKLLVERDALKAEVEELKRLLRYTICDVCGFYCEDLGNPECFEANHVEARAALKGGSGDS